jgi:hypothetical protein
MGLAGGSGLQVLVDSSSLLSLVRFFVRWPNSSFYRPRRGSTIKGILEKESQAMVKLSVLTL